MIPAGQKIKLIITDDHSLFRTGIRISLAKYPDIEIAGEAENGQQLLQLLEQMHPDMITLGIQMPVMDGLATLPVLKKQYPHIRVIIYSMYNDPSMICRMIELGASTYLNKESGSGDLYECIQALRTRHFYINDTILNAMIKLKAALAADTRPVFSAKEILILKFLKENMPVKDMADQVDLSSRTVLAIIDKLKGKASVKDIAGLLAFAEQNDLLK
ncbi:MAG: response regulator transcription factor [Chitinophagaceae bacterium]